MIAEGKIALAHHWLVTMRGGEKVLEQFCLLFPGADIYTLVSRPERLSATLQAHCILNSPLQKFPKGSQRYKSLLPFFPAAVSRLRVKSSAQFLLSSDASVIKGLSYPKDIPHVCYCHSPPRYLWDLQETYAKQAGGLGGFGRLVFRQVTPYVRRFDAAAAKRVTHFIANSKFVQSRIQRVYGRDSVVIHPPVDVDAFTHTRASEDFYLVVSELTPYKRLDIVVDAFNELGRRLVIIGDGSEAAHLRSRAKANITFLGRAPFPILKDHLERCRAFLYPQIEDFGITALEAQAAGKPVIAFGEGGALESIIENVTGAFFREQTSLSLADAVREFEKTTFDALMCRKNAELFGPEIFRAKIADFLAEKFPELFAGFTSSPAP